MVPSLQNQNQAEYTEKMNELTLHSAFQCFKTEFCERMTLACREFFSTELFFNLTEISYEPSRLWKENDYFVTQISLGREVNLALKLSDIAINLVFINSLGKKQDESGDFKLKNITELEAQIVTAYNEFLYKQVSELFLTPKEINSVIHTLQDTKTVYLNFYVYTQDEKEAGRVILSFPMFVFKKINPVVKPEELLNLDFFNNSRIETDILIGKTTASLDDIKNLEPEDLIILDKSNIYTMFLREFEDASLNMNPGSGLMIEFDDNENGDNAVIEQKAGNKSIWDSLEVEVNAGFEKVRMKLGDLREITEGLVIDVASVAQNKVYIDVEGQKLAAGELVIIGDKYGVRITEIFDEAKSAEVEKLEEQGSGLSVRAGENPEEDDEDFEDEDTEIDEDFEESDFDLDDEED